MSRISTLCCVLLAAYMMTGLTAFSSIPVHAQAKKKKDAKKDEKKDAVKDEKKDDKKDVKKDDKDKKEEKKEPFKPEPAQIELKIPEKDKSYWVFAVAFSDDGKSVAAVYRDRTARIWDLAKKEAQMLKGQPGEPKGLVFSKNQAFVSTGKWNKEKKAYEGEIKIWDAKAGKETKSLKGHSAEIEGLALSKDGKFLASASQDKTAIIWDLSTGKESQTIKGHGDKVNSISFSPDGKQVVTTSGDKTVRVWDVAGAKEIALFKVEKTVDNKDPKSGKVTQVKELGREFTCAIFSADGKRVIAGSVDGYIKVYDVEGKKEVTELKGHEMVWALALSPDGTKLASSGGDNASGTIKLWNAADYKEERMIKAHMSNVIALAFSPDNQWLASGSTDGLVKIWSVGKK